MYRFKDMHQTVKRFPHLAHLLRDYDFNMLEVRMSKIKTEKHLKNATAISEELAEMLKIAEEYKETNEHDNVLDLIVRTIRLRKNLFDTMCARTIVITKFQ